ncbi:MAG: hypothetical protein IPJ69_03010 [Deltaproteobacteria bacterium]|nr:MAG: hypothetical protein IPJ69_03010 [Deltaproteobacteria bacterium]
MSFGRIESGGNQVKDSMTQLTELTQNQQSNFHETLNETCKQEDKKTSDTQSTQEASQTNQTNTQKDQDQVQAVKSDSSKQDSQESKDQEDADNSVQETKNEDSQSLKKQDEEVLLDEEQTINQSDMLLLSLLIQPQIQQTPTTQTPQTQEVMTAMTEDTDTSQAENSAMFIQINTNLKSSDEQNLEIKDPKTEENTSTLESSLLPQEQQLANNTAKLENTTPTIKSPAPSLKKEEEDDTPVQSKQETSTINKTPFQQIKVENKNTMKQTTNFSSDTTPTDDTQETKREVLK